MNCPRCGTVILPGSTLCANCGLLVARKPKRSAATFILIVLVVVFGIMAAVLFSVFAEVRDNARLEACESNVEQIELGMIQYTRGHKGEYPASSAGYKSALMPYLQNKKLFHCPAETDGGDSYSFNKNLQGMSMEKISNLSLVVAVYEGKNQTLDFRHDGQAIVGFADGSHHPFTAVEARKLQWQP